jgi:hypothetical protein
MSQKEKSVFWEVIVSAILSKKVYMYMYLIPNGFRGRAISLYSSKIVENVTYSVVRATKMAGSSSGDWIY